jgi:hypothetical protein
VTNWRYTAVMANERKELWETEELRMVLSARHLEFEAQHQQLMAKLERPFPGTDLPKWEPSAASREADVRLKALQDYARNLPPDFNRRSTA